MSNGKGTKERCLCGYRRRGSNHDKGQHHKQWAGKQKVHKPQVGG